MQRRNVQSLGRPPRLLLVPRWRDAPVLFALAVFDSASAPSSLASSDPGPSVVVTDGGQVTLVDLVALRTRAEALQKEANEAVGEATSLRALAEGLWAQLRGKLIASREKWSPNH